MDTLTHMALGACIGEVVSRKKLGRKAMAFGAIAQLIPDIDFVYGLWMNPVSNALAHRGFTHSLLFGIIISGLLAWMFRRWWRNKSISYNFWLTIIGVQVFVHIVLDAFNAYGTGWFEPFSHYRVSFNTLFVADPFFSVPLGIAVLILLVTRMDNTKRHSIAVVGIAYCSFYLAFGIANKFAIESDVKRAFAQQNIPHEKYFTTPTPFNNWLWYVVSSNEAGSYVGYRSVFDKVEHIDFEFFPRNDSLLSLVPKQKEIELLKRLSQGYYTIEPQGDTLIFNDLRYGQMIGWQYPRAGFVFHYYLRPDLDNTLVLQRGRFANWDWAATKAFLKRIKGKK
jgi:inner membrane protein